MAVGDSSGIGRTARPKTPKKPPIVALVPFPTATATTTLQSATDCLKQALQGAGDGLQDIDLQRLARAASDRIMRYAPGAPADTRDEALIRAVAWLSQSGGIGAVSSETIGRKTIEYDLRAVPGWFRFSGSMSLLSPWRVRNAGMVEA